MVMRLTIIFTYMETQDTWFASSKSSLISQYYIDANFTYYLHSQVPLTFTCLWGGGNFSDFLKPPPPKEKGFPLFIFIDVR